MNPKLKALQDDLQALIDDGKTLASKETLTDSDNERMESLAGEIDAKKKEIARVKALDDSLAEAEGYLNGAPKDLKSIAGAIEDPEAKIAAARMAHVPGRAKAFESIGYTREEAKFQAYKAGMFYLATLTIDGKPLPGRAKAERFCKENGLLPMAGATEGVNEDGGYLVVPEIDNDLILLREKFGIFRQYARNSPMSSEVKRRFRQTGGLTTYWVDEEGTITDSKSNFDLVQLNAKKLAILALVSGELNEDSALDFGEITSREIAYAFAKKEDQCGFAGDGTSTYARMVGVRQRLYDVHGGASGDAYGLVLSATGGWSAITMAHLESVAGVLPAYADDGNPCWFCHKNFYWTVMYRLILALGGVTATEAVNGVQQKFLGYPVVFSQAMPAATGVSQVPVVLGDLSLAADFGDRRMTTIAMSEHYKFANDQLAIRGIERFDINVHDVGDSATPGPIVGLVTGAS